MSNIICPHCGRNAKKTDKFCIFCGKPLITEISKPKKEREGKEDKSISSEISDKKEKDSKGKKKKFTPFSSGDLDPPEDEKEEDDGEDDKKKSIPFSEEDEFLDEDLDLDSAVMEQLEAKMDISILGMKKEKLKGKLKEIMKDVKSEKYEYDIDFAKEVNIKLDAIKQIMAEIQEKEDKLIDKIGVFKLDELDHVVEERRAQLTELKKKFKFGKIKKNIFEQLKREYASDFKEAQEEQKELQKQIRIWMSKLKSEKNREEVKIKMLEGRFSTKEIKRERFEEEKVKHKKLIDELDNKIKLLRNFSGKIT